jgi:hypothetical protein
LRPVLALAWALLLAGCSAFDPQYGIVNHCLDVDGSYIYSTRLPGLGPLSVGAEGGGCAWDDAGWPEADGEAWRPDGSQAWDARAPDAARDARRSDAYWDGPAETRPGDTGPWD